jgi:hypothetical protein
MKLEDQKTEAEATIKAAKKAVRDIEKSEEWITLDKACDAASDAEGMHRQAAEKGRDAHLRKLLKMPKRTTWEQQHEALRQLAGRWAGFTKEDLRARHDDHQSRSLAREASGRVMRALFEVFPVPEGAAMKKEAVRLEKVKEAARFARQPLGDQLRREEHRLSRANYELREVEEKIRKREDRKADRARATSTPEKTKTTTAHKESRKRLRELTGFGVEGWHKDRKAEPHEKALRAWLKTELS